MAQEKCPAKLQEIVQTLFPTHPAGQQLLSNANDHGSIMRVTADGILEAAKKVGVSKALGPDNFPNIATKEALMRLPEVYAAIMQTCNLSKHLDKAKADPPPQTR